VRTLAATAPHVDAVQLELGIPLRWPGAWRQRLIDAILAALPALVAPRDTTPPSASVPEPDPPLPCRLEFAAPGLSGLVGIDAGRGARLLFFPAGGGLALFTGERVGLEPEGAAGALGVRVAAGGGLSVRFDGPLLRFPDTMPFLDLEAGLGRAEVIDASVTLDFVPHHADRSGGDFGAVSGVVVLDGARHPIATNGFLDDGAAPSPWPRLRAALELADGARLALTVGLDGGQASGFLCRGAEHVAVATARATLGDADAPLDPVRIDLELADGTKLRVTAHAMHRLPVIRARGGAPIRLEFAACRVDGGGAAPAGWLEAGGL